MYLRKKDLIKLLKPYNDNDIIILQKDFEGTGDKKPLGKIKKCVYLPHPHDKRAGQTYIRKLSDKLIAQGFSEKDLCPDKARGLPSIVLIPIE